MLRLPIIVSLGILCACPEPEPDPLVDPAPNTNEDPSEHDTDTSEDTASGDDTHAEPDTDTGGDTGDPPEPEMADWTLLVFMNGDNDLESAIWDDLNELEASGSSENIHVIVQVDRHDEYWSGDGDWTEARRYYITQDTDDGSVASTLLEDLGEVDMGDPEVLSDFLLWAHENYPAERIALSMWNHGDGWSAQGDTPPPFISWDMTDNGWMSIAAGQFNEALDPIVAIRGPIEIVGFDACNMASWEVAHSLRGRAEYMVGSETTVGMDGFHYREILETMHASPKLSTEEVAHRFAWSAGDFNEEWTFSVTDIGQIDALSSTIDALAGSVLDDPLLSPAFVDSHADARGVDYSWQDYYLDLGDLARALSESDESTLANHGRAIRQALAQAVPHNYAREPYAWASGLTIYSDLDWEYLRDYADGSGASWSQETRWDDLLIELAGGRPN